jgi:hypothetical protein
MFTKGPRDCEATCSFTKIHFKTIHIKPSASQYFQYFDYSIRNLHVGEYRLMYIVDIHVSLNRKLCVCFALFYTVYGFLFLISAETQGELRKPTLRVFVNILLIM